MKILCKNSLSRTVVRSLAVAVLLAALPDAPLRAQQAPDAAHEAEIIQRVRDAVMKELREGDFLQKEIERGIKDYVRKQREAEAAARAERQRQASEKAKNVRRVSRTRDHIYGNPDAPVSLIEYSDFECPYCKRFHATPRRVVETYKGKVNWVYRHFPLAFHNPGARKQAEASECAAALGGNEGFWKYADAIYTRTRSGGTGFPLNKLVPLAKEIGLDEEKFRQCLNGGEQTARVEEDLTEGARIGVTGTPATVILNNLTGETRLREGAQPLSAFTADVGQMLGK